MPKRPNFCCDFYGAAWDGAAWAHHRAARDGIPTPAEWGGRTASVGLDCDPASRVRRGYRVDEPRDRLCREPFACVGDRSDQSDAIKRRHGIGEREHTRPRRRGRRHARRRHRTVAAECHPGRGRPSSTCRCSTYTVQLRDAVGDQREERRVYTSLVPLLVNGTRAAVPVRPCGQVDKHRVRESHGVYLLLVSRAIANRRYDEQF